MWHKPQDRTASLPSWVRAEDTAVPLEEDGAAFAATAKLASGGNSFQCGPVGVLQSPSTCWGRGSR